MWGIVVKNFVLLGLWNLVLGDDEKQQFVLTASGTGEDFFRENIMYGADGRSPVSIECRTIEASVHPMWQKSSADLCGTGATSLDNISCEEGEGSATLIFDVLNDSTSGNYTCSAGGIYKDGFEESTLSVFVKDDRINMTDSIGPELDMESITIYCSPDAGIQLQDPDPEWYLNGELIEIREGGDHLVYGPDERSIIVNNPGRRDSGVYMCVYKETKEPDGTFYVRSYTDVFSLPYIYDDKKPSTNAMEGDNTKLVCKAYGHPVAKLTWQKKAADTPVENIPYFDIKRHYTLSEHNNINNGTLNIHNLIFDDRAEYICVASNKYNETSHGLMLRVKGKLAALWPFLGIVAEVVILVLVIFLYERHQKKKQSHEDESEDLAEQKQALTPNQDLRQRKG